MVGTLCVIGVGPGDPELLTVKALHKLKNASVICVPKGREEGKSLALSIVEKAVDLDGREIMEAYFPMKKTRERKEGHKSYSVLDEKWDETVNKILGKLVTGADVAFITLGDPTIYSTFYYLYDKILSLKPGLNIQVIPGISSVNASAASAGIPLGLADEKIAIIPATYEKDVRAVLMQFDTVVLMKVHKVFDRVVHILEEMEIADNAVYICRAGMEDEKVINNIRNVEPDDLNYFSTVIVKNDRK
jgi:precorrin-2/cobalt-factor-2 C20-methyltransferase